MHFSTWLVNLLISLPIHERLHIPGVTTDHPKLLASASLRPLPRPNSSVTLTGAHVLDEIRERVYTVNRTRSYKSSNACPTYHVELFDVSLCIQACQLLNIKADRRFRPSDLPMVKWMEL
jgi:hypothetical protein